MVKINQLRARVELECAKRGWSLAYFARKLGKSPQALNDLIKHSSHRESTIRELSAALDITVDYFSTPVSPVEYGEAMIPIKEEEDEND